jgi:surfeit locus 1 family protein
LNAKVRYGIITLGAVLAVALAVALGRWQLGRASQKLALHAQMQAQSAKAVLDARSITNAVDPEVLLYQTAQLTGQWVQNKTIFLDNRQMDTRVGFFVTTPLLVQGGTAAVLVQRGWVPRNFKDRTSLPNIETPLGVVQLQGRIAPWPSKLYELGSPSTGAIRQNLNLAQLRAETDLPLLGVTLQQTGAPSEGLLRNWTMMSSGVDKHYGYAFQWFGIAALVTVLYLWFQIVRRFIYRPKSNSTDV